MAIITHSSSNYIILEAEDGDVASLVTAVSDYLATNNWTALGGIAVKTNSNILQVLGRKSLL